MANRARRPWCWCGRLLPLLLLPLSVSADMLPVLDKGLLVPAATVAPARWRAQTPERAHPAPPALLDAHTPAPAILDWLPDPGPPAPHWQPLAPSTSSDSCIARGAEGQFMGWVDRQQCVFSGRTIAAARWVDDLFGDWDDSDASMQLRVINELTTVEGDGAAFKLRLRAKANLPRAKRRLRLIISSDADQDGRVAGQDALSQLRPAPTDISAALRWMSRDQGFLKTDFDVGVRGLGPPDIFARFRVREDWDFWQKNIFRLGQTLRYGTESEGRSITQFDLERLVDKNSVARLSSAYEYDQTNNENGMVWSQGISLSHILTGNKSLSYGITVNGHMNPQWRSDNKGPWLVWRSSVLRDWLFYEIEPRLTWYNTEQRNDWYAVTSLTLRLEIQFGRK